MFLYNVCHKENKKKEKADSFWNYYQDGGDDGCPVLRPKVKGTALEIWKYVLAPELFAGQISATSDEKLKKNITDLPLEVANKLSLLSPKQYKFKDNVKSIRYGLIAQDVEKIFPELIIENSNIKTVNYLEIIPLLLLKVNELEREIIQLKNK